MSDILGQALLDFHHGKHTNDMVTWTNISDEDTLPLAYLFRTFEDMPKIEQRALKMARGNILDVGCGAGGHSLWLQDKGLKVHAIDSSKGAVEVCALRGIKHVTQTGLLDVTATYDTILILMNGTGIFQNMKHLSSYLLHLKSILNPQGQVLIDSTDIAYMYQNEDGTSCMEINPNYYGELKYYMSYNGKQATAMEWLYLDFDTLKQACHDAGLNCEKIEAGDHHDYLAKLS